VKNVVDSSGYCKWKRREMNETNEEEGPIEVGDKGD
jgi:hypothetical protein